MNWYKKSQVLETTETKEIPNEKDWTKENIDNHKDTMGKTTRDVLNYIIKNYPNDTIRVKDIYEEIGASRFTGGAIRNLINKGYLKEVGWGTGYSYKYIELTDEGLYA